MGSEEDYFVEVEFTKNTEAYRRLSAAGFTIDYVSRCKRIHPDYPEEDFIWEYNVSFSCICKMEEVLVVRMSDAQRRIDHNPYFPELDLIDAAFAIEQAGAVAEEHLRQDGFTEDQILMIRRPYEGMIEKRYGK